MCAKDYSYAVIVANSRTEVFTLMRIITFLANHVNLKLYLYGYIFELDIENGARIIRYHVIISFFDEFLCSLSVLYS